MDTICFDSSTGVTVNFLEPTAGLLTTLDSTHVVETEVVATVLGSVSIFVVGIDFVVVVVVTAGPPVTALRAAAVEPSDTVPAVDVVVLAEVTLAVMLVAVVVTVVVDDSVPVAVTGVVTVLVAIPTGPHEAGVTVTVVPLVEGKVEGVLPPGDGGYWKISFSDGVVTEPLPTTCADSKFSFCKTIK